MLSSVTLCPVVSVRLCVWSHWGKGSVPCCERTSLADLATLSTSVVTPTSYCLDSSSVVPSPPPSHSSSPPPPIMSLTSLAALCLSKVADHFGSLEWAVLTCSPRPLRWWLLPLLWKRGLIHDGNIHNVSCSSTCVRVCARQLHLCIWCFKCSLLWNSRHCVVEWLLLPRSPSQTFLCSPVLSLWGKPR